MRRFCLMLILAVGFANTASAFELRSNSFPSKGNIPAAHTCDDRNVSPPLHWTDPPEGAQSFALIVDDPDAPIGTWVHWVMYNLPHSKRSLEGEISDSEVLSDGIKQGMSDFNQVGYGGPCPPSGKPHHYHFKLYALDTVLDLPSGQTKTTLLQAMQGHILAEAQLIGLYQRKS